MQRVLLVMLFACTSAFSQSPQELLRSAQDVYKDTSGFEIKGIGKVRPSGSSWQMNFDLTLAAKRAEPAVSGQPQNPTQVGLAVGGFHPINVGDNKAEDVPSLVFPFAVAGQWDRIAEKVIAVRENGTETLPLNGSPVACRILEVNYKLSEDSPPDSSHVIYSICSEKHLVLRKTINYPTDTHSTGSSAVWTLTFNTAHFNHPTPQWLIDAENAPSFVVRNEWVGRPAPEFSMFDLNGSQVKLSSLRGKVVLLDFWSVTCPPCVRELPMVEAIGQSFAKRNVILWGVAFDQPEQSRKWLLQHQRSMPTLSDTEFSVSDSYKIQGIPAVVIVGRDGTIKNYWTGEVPLAELQSALQQASKD